jgi:hypothetical protein
LVEEAEASAATANETIDVLACNWTTVDMFRGCQLSFVGGAGRAICMGIAATEIHAALQLRCLPRRQWPEVAQGIQLMGRMSASTINKKLSAASSTG